MAAIGREALSAREDEVLHALGEHLTNAEIGQRLHISVRTVESHVSSLLRKLEVADRRALAALAAADSDRTAAPGAAGIAGLPSAWTTFVGRSAEVGEVLAALEAGRLVTLLGPGGIGKTRLATVAAAAAEPSFAGGAFVDLVPVGPELVVQAAAAALDVVERPGEPLERLVHERLRGGRVLLVLDNCEHVLGAAATFVAGLLAACPDAVVLATSRERLGVPGERVVPVPGLDCRASDGASEAAQLFIERTNQASGLVVDPVAAAEVVERLEGMPLAIELAAARTGSLGLDGLLAGFEDHLRLLAGTAGPEGRHRSLRAVIDWSHNLLDDDERRAFRQLAVFTGAVDLDAVAEVVTAGDVAEATDLVGRLADKSLLAHRRGAAGSRWRMLETVHAYAQERLDESGEGPAVAARHVAWAHAAAVALEAGLDDADPWQSTYDALADDLRAALAQARAEGHALAAYDLARCLAHLAYGRRFLREARDHFELAIELAPDDAEAVVAMHLAARAWYAEMKGDRAFDLVLDAAARAERAGDLATAAASYADAVSLGGRCPGIITERDISEPRLLALLAQAEALAPAGDPVVDAHVALARAWVSNCRFPSDVAPALAAAALELVLVLDDPVLISDALDAVASAEAAQGRFRAAARHTAARSDLLPRMERHDPRTGGEVVDIFHMGSEAAMSIGDLVGALAVSERSTSDRSLQSLSHFPACHRITPLALLGELDAAVAEAVVSRTGWERAGRPGAAWMSPWFLGAALAEGVRGNHLESAEWWDLAVELCMEAWPNAFLRYVGPRLAMHTGDLDRAAALADDRGEWGGVWGGSMYRGYATAMQAELACVARWPDADRLVEAAAAQVAENAIAAAHVQRARGRLHDDRHALEGALGGFEAAGARFERACTLLLLPDRADEGARELAAVGATPPAI